MSIIYVTTYSQSTSEIKLSFERLHNLCLGEKNNSVDQSVYMKTQVVFNLKHWLRLHKRGQALLKKMLGSVLLVEAATYARFSLETMEEKLCS